MIWKYGTKKGQNTFFHYVSFNFFKKVIIFSFNITHDWKALDIIVHLAPRNQGHSFSVQCYDEFGPLAIIFQKFIQTQPRITLTKFVCKTRLKRLTKVSLWGCVLACSGFFKRLPNLLIFYPKLYIHQTNLNLKF